MDLCLLACLPACLDVEDPEEAERNGRQKANQSRRIHADTQAETKRGPGIMYHMCMVYVSTGGLGIIPCVIFHFHMGFHIKHRLINNCLLFVSFLRNPESLLNNC